MLRFTLFLMAAAAIGSQILAAPLPKDAAYVFTFPTSVGAKWVYESNGVERERVITDVAEFADGKRVTYRDTGRGRILAINKRGLFEVEQRETTALLTTHLLKLPRVDGRAWDITTGEAPTDKTVVWRKAHGPEWITVPAGKFLALRVQEGHGGNSEEYRTIWFVSGIGKVKEVNGDSIDVLKSFTPPRD